MYQNIDKLNEHVDSRFTLVILASKRAREINKYLNSLKRGELAQVKGPQLEMLGDKPLTIAFKEIVQDKISYTRDVDGIK